MIYWPPSLQQNNILFSDCSPKLGSNMRLSALVSLLALILLVSSVNGSLLILPLDIVEMLPLEVDGSDDGWTDRCSLVKKASYKQQGHVLIELKVVFDIIHFSSQTPKLCFWIVSLTLVLSPSWQIIIIRLT